MIPASVILENSLNIMYVKSNHDLDIVYSNSNFNEYASHISPKNVAHFIKNEEDMSFAKKAMAKAKKQNPFPVGFQCQLKQKNGAMRWSMWEVVYDEDGYHFIGVQLFDVISITAHDYDRQQRILERIAWIQSHKVRRPLSNILALADLIYKGASDSDRLDKKGEAVMLKKAAAELDEVIREIVDASSEGNY